jgi:hypothetical protein
MGVLGVFALTACSSEEMIPDKPNLPEEELNSRFMTVTIRNSEGNTRAGGDQSGNLYEEGLDQENKVESIRFYFFDKDGEPYKISYTGKNYYDCEEIEEDGANMPNVEKKLKAVIVLTSDNEDEKFEGINSMIAIANFQELDISDENMSLAQLKAITDDYYEIGPSPTLNSNYRFVMTSSSFGSTDGYGCEVKIDTTPRTGNIKTTREEAETNPVEIYVERLVAKVRVSTAWSNQMDTKAVKLNGKDYVAVKLKERKDNNVEDIVDSKGDKIYAIFTAWDLSGYTDKSYLFKQVNPAWSFDPSWTWNVETLHRSFWAMNAEGVKFQRRKHSDAIAKIGSRRQSGSSTNNPSNLVSYDGDVLYCQENAADWSPNLLTNSGKKIGYDPETAVGNRTQVYIKAILVKVDDAGVATPVDLAIWGDIKYLESDLLTAMLSSVQNLIYTRDKEPYETTTETKEDGSTVTIKKYHYHALTEDQVRLVNAQDADKADDKSENSRRYLSYIQLKKNDEIFPVNTTLDGKFYQPDAATPGEYVAIERKDADGILSNMPGARVWRGGDTYYYIDIAHLNKQEGAEEVGMYGIVRNHIYDVEINNVYGLGTPVLTPQDGEGDEKDIIPQKPTNEAFYLGARMNILSWRVVNQEVNLDWD